MACDESEQAVDVNVAAPVDVAVMPVTPQIH
jgi:hypothetical protein